ncbi:hypothetical protein GGR25_002764 [Kaistia hirudinis]|uniref:Uncharacterized protein n=1 Tax=Kaistia hirudinis TaxID=1293440 RepID=A0A840AQL0_9HYPH|nr:hypothetical protein [Kaistia hirudinis]
MEEGEPVVPFVGGVVAVFRLRGVTSPRRERPKCDAPARDTGTAAVRRQRCRGADFAAGWLEEKATPKVHRARPKLCHARGAGGPEAGGSGNPLSFVFFSCRRAARAPGRRPPRAPLPYPSAARAGGANRAEHFLLRRKTLTPALSRSRERGRQPKRPRRSFPSLLRGAGLFLSPPLEGGPKTPWRSRGGASFGAAEACLMAGRVCSSRTETFPSACAPAPRTRRRFRARPPGAG